MPCSNGLSPLPAAHPTGHAMTGCGPPSSVNSTSSWPRVDHNGFGSYESDLGAFAPAKMASLSLRLSACHFHTLPGSCFEKNDGTLLSTPRLHLTMLASACFNAHAHTFLSPPSFRSFHSHTCGFFSAFPRGTCSLSVSSQCLGLEFNAPSSRSILELRYSSRRNLRTRFAYEAVTLYGGLFQGLRLT